MPEGILAEPAPPVLNDHAGEEVEVLNARGRVREEMPRCQDPCLEEVRDLVGDVGHSPDEHPVDREQDAERPKGEAGSYGAAAGRDRRLQPLSELRSSSSDERSGRDGEDAGEENKQEGRVRPQPDAENGSRRFAPTDLDGTTFDWSREELPLPD
jgi:hypothetical protein